MTTPIGPRPMQPGGGLTLNVSPLGFKTEMVERGDEQVGLVREYFILILTWPMEFKIGPFTEDQWTSFITAAADPVGAAERAAARSQIVQPGPGQLRGNGGRIH